MIILDRYYISVLIGSAAEHCFNACIDYPKDYLTPKQKKCLDECVNKFQKDYSEIVKSYKKKNKSSWFK